jgi:hypothetical protein
MEGPPMTVRRSAPTAREEDVNNDEPDEIE